jgi:hypothetical protein
VATEPYQQKLAQLIAIVQDCLRVHPNVTDAKDAALTVLARRGLKVDIPTLNQTLDAVVERQARQQEQHRVADHRERVDRSIDWSAAARTLAQAGLLPQPEAREARCGCGHSPDVHHDPDGRPVSRYCRVVGCGRGAYRERGR